MRRLWCWVRGHDRYDTCKGDSCWGCRRCGEQGHDSRLPVLEHEVRGRRPVLISSASWAALSPEMRRKLFSNTVVKLYSSLDELPRIGQREVR